jgi:hypothetical protein
MKILKLLIVFIMMLPCSGKAVEWHITDAYIEPNQPTDIEVITIVVSGVEGSGPVLITDSDFQVKGNSLELNIFLLVGYYGMITQWSHSDIIGSLPADEYNLTVNAYYSGAYTGTDTYLISFTVVPTTVIEADIDINPNTLNLQSKGKWLTCHIWLPDDYNVADIEPNSVRLISEPNDIYPDWLWFEGQEQLAMAKFNRSQFEGILLPGDVELTLTGQLTDGTIFEGTDVIRVIDKRRQRK